LDNLKEGVIKSDIYEPELNPVYNCSIEGKAELMGRWRAKLERHFNYYGVGVNYTVNLF
jgi:hypothetical protein